MNAELPPDADPPPVAPPRPTLADCCRGGCEPCVFDLYAAALEDYEADLRAWHERALERSRRAPDDAAAARRR